eukprot:TRINITY_DN64145_c0_g1_i1.p3 TRINITY_DN64145_c0_g1~~TRINITY_DN64145_c0_g1_i1.p3  ORF type:complete len:106 (+),score=14.68 TRINITY_DN64145_c0_g1_i1:101-418(+)
MFKYASMLKSIIQMFDSTFDTYKWVDAVRPARGDCYDAKVVRLDLLNHTIDHDAPSVLLRNLLQETTSAPIERRTSFALQTMNLYMGTRDEHVVRKKFKMLVTLA